AVAAAHGGEVVVDTGKSGLQVTILLPSAT
ncbi:MAG: hypothetical protein V4564_10840, partial [Pseudomonadota bacterium]